MVVMSKSNKLNEMGMSKVNEWIHLLPHLLHIPVQFTAFELLHMKVTIEPLAPVHNLKMFIRIAAWLVRSMMLSCHNFYLGWFDDEITWPVIFTLGLFVHHQLQCRQIQSIDM